jgi:hypothetical protein
LFDITSSLNMMYGTGPRLTGRYPIGYGQQISPSDLDWRLRWPFTISIIIGVVMIVVALVINALEIASLAKFTNNIILNGNTYGRTASTGAGIWCGFFFLVAAVLMILISKENFFI